MTQGRTQLYFLPADHSITRKFNAGVSLHSHTEHSKEKLKDLPRHLEQMPVVSQFLRWEKKRYYEGTGRNLDFSRAYWRGPLSAHAACELERLQIERLNLRAMVSLTDHDNIEAGLLLQPGRPSGEVPISVEWTVPFEKTYFHLGIHNLAPAQATSLMHTMAEYTQNPLSCKLGDLLEALQSDPGVLIVLNHPLWDMAGVGCVLVTATVKRFLGTYGPYIHALEINGLRSWQENLGAISLANQSGHPVVAGGDRHGMEPNAVLNVTRASTFAEFVEEIRMGRSSDILVQPQYKEPLGLRHLLTAWDVVREHPQFAEKQHWVARVFVLCYDGVERPLSAVWKDGAPGWIDPCLNVIGMIASSPVRTAARIACQAAGSTAR